MKAQKRSIVILLIESFLPKAKKDDPLTQKKIREISDKVVPVWAIESNGFRSFRYDRVSEVKIIPYGNGGLEGNED